ncbi:MAG: hypothetical protein IT162_21205, partial [Bryobacterales bacterium]|nr:hypothetical protein [Bryobacterales bacterium]
MAKQIGQATRAVLGSVVSALGFGASAAVAAAATAGAASATPDHALALAAANVVAQLVAGLAVNYTSDKLTPLLDGTGAAGDGPEVNHDLERVAKLSLLTLLYDVLDGQGVSASERDRCIQQAGEAWDLRLIPTTLSATALVDLLREPAAIETAEASEIAQQILPPGARGHHADFTLAISAWFARTYEVLLRSDERAHRAAVIYLQRMNLQEVSGVRRDLEILTKPQPVLERYEALRKPVDAPPAITDLQFKRRATRYRVRPAVDRQLRDWLLADDRFRILKLTGAAGMGKSRLAMELVDLCHAELWLAGFVTENGWPVGGEWQPLRDTLVVLDYAAFKTVAGLDAFAWLKKLYLQSSAKKVRVVLVDRSEQGPLWADWRGDELADDLNRCTLAVDLQPDQQEFTALALEELARRIGGPPNQEQRGALDAVAARLRGQFRPLFAALTGSALAAGERGKTSPWSPEELVASVLKAQMHQWQRAGVTDEQLDLLFEATWTQGACNNDPDFARRLDTLSQHELDALATLSDPGPRLGGIVPDLLGEFIVLARLRPDIVPFGQRQTRRTAEISRGIVERSWGNGAAEEFAGRLLEDYLPWSPETVGGENPAEWVMEGALRRLEAGYLSQGLEYCAFAAAWRRPASRDWAGGWLEQCGPAAMRWLVRPVAIGLFNATVGERDPALCLALADRIEALHRGEDPSVREQLGKALFNATVWEQDPMQRLSLAHRIAELHDRYGHEQGIRESLANALMNVTAVEPEPAQRLALANQIAELHEKYGEESVVRVQLAKALYNATVGEIEPARRMELAARIAELHERYGEEPAVREQLAKAL